ncbi:mismatch repair endonuclease PMS2-like [Physella acuta]|uniref:mismatch repair endonuclease PMS2-like n=1 Tax=Physella acuta TaxID=109671 RepID=UPI0027DB76A9|nr:mismatch repair endonuclease PMS2-like [Physella acuta]
MAATKTENTKSIADEPSQSNEFNANEPDELFDSQEIPECTKRASSIQAIDKASVHRICSGQVVLTLATAVKELVENSIDAGATSVEIRLKEYGSENIEVIDNGSGVEEANFEGLTLKHHTSKLQEFEDLVNVTTFGFRGEALSSLCALSIMSITTRHQDASVGTRLDFDLNGKIVTRKSAPRQIGTTVQIQNIFHTLPVRHKEFQRNLKKEFAKLVHVLNAYCIVNTGVRITCSNQTGKGSRSVVVSTNGNETMKENIGNLFSPKQVQSLLEFKQVVPSDEVCSDFGIKPQQNSNFRIEGFVSKCEHGQGRSSTDRQFIFINKRPCDSAKILKLINEVYHSYNRHQNPFIALSITMDKESVDVNVTPDKRQIFLEGEKLLLAVIKTSLIQMFESTTSVYKVNNILSPLEYSQGKMSTDNSFISGTNLQKVSSPCLSSSLSQLKRSFSSAFDKGASGLSPESVGGVKKNKSLTSDTDISSRTITPLSQQGSASQGSIKDFLTRLKPSQSVPKAGATPSKTSPTKTSPDTCTSGLVFEPVSLSWSGQSLSEDVVDVDVEESNAKGDNLQSDSCFSSSWEGKQQSSTSHSSTDGDYFQSKSSLFPPKGDCTQGSTSHSSTKGDNLQSITCLSSTHCISGLETDSETKTAITKSDTKCCDSKELIAATDESQEVSKEFLYNKNTTSIPQSNDDSIEGTNDQPFKLDSPAEKLDVTQTREQVIKFSLEALQKKVSTKITKSESDSNFCRSFRAKICPTDNSSAEEELQREISKDMFAKMEILGQFNLGFIITKLGRDLFIVDQHATDEKYNFEMLQRNTVLQSQRMIAPQNLELTASNETILVDNIDVFKKNGFDFIVEADAPPTQRVKLSSAPASRNWSFGKDDIEELLFMLTDSPNVMCRPSRIRMMFASRACRKSVMIGTALNKSEMKRLVTHMGEIEQPWNCPHGRPTMRHLFNLDMLPT